MLGADREPWSTGYGRVLDRPDVRITALSEHHVTIACPDADAPSLDTRLRLMPNHVCQTLNLVDDVRVASDGVLVDRWHVIARGWNS